MLNVGAGAGSYEPSEGPVIAVEPSEVMLSQRAGRSAPAIRAVGEWLPVRDRAFDVALAVLTIHHWPDPIAGLRELQRVASRQVILHFEPDYAFWLADEYFPNVRAVDAGVPTVAEVVAALGNTRVEPIPVPHDCVDGFFAAYWRRPGAYLDPSVRANISNLARVGDGDLGLGLDRLRRDLASGAWEAEHRDLLARDELDVGYRLIIAG
ncbi:MAG TPA: methyltransferase domain-containing protein [Cellulomonadaceae bacterium]|nr:methyltransferase domain-containing protein [Cellulomonadaceae bacterium]